MKYQLNARLLLIYIILSVGVIQDACDFQMFMFIEYPPKHFCKFNTSFESVKISEDQCSYTAVMENNSTVNFNCTQWTYDTSQIQSTIVTDYDLVCQNTYKQLMILPLRSLAALPVIFMGFFADYFGRKYVFMILLYLDSLFWILTAFFSYNFELFLTFRLLKSSVKGYTYVGFILATEITHSKHRDFVGLNYWAIYGFGLAIASGFLKLTLHWNSAYKLAMLPNIIYLLVPFVLVESPKWLIVNNRKREAEIILKQLNQFTIHDSIDLNRNETNKESSLSNFDDEYAVNYSNLSVNFKSEIKAFFNKPALVKRLLTLLFGGLGFNLVYMGVATQLELAFKDIYISTALLGLMEVPSGPLSIPMMRRNPTRSLLICGLVGIGIYVCSPALWVPAFKLTIVGGIAHLIMTCISKLLLITSWNILGMFSVTLIPTNLRNFVSTLGSLTSTLGQALGSFVGLYFEETSNKHHGITANIIYAVILLLAFLLIGLVIPSISASDKQSLPNTVEEAAQIRNTSGKWNLKVLWIQMKLKYQTRYHHMDQY